ncbi:vWA domain-containing protein [Mycolicibacterium vaccae]|uniref:vWA domain-containing protein n=1 Tax=Mycolicibacterium vaccae TaxID=1810 RepID=UPI003CF4F938
MTFDPIAPAPALAVLAAVLVLLRLVSLRPAISAGRESLARWAAMTVALTLVVLAAFRPGVGDVEDTATSTGANGGTNIFFVVDRSADSAIADFGGQARMAGMRADMAELMDLHPDARFAVISFASRPAVEWPLSADNWSLTPVLSALLPYPGDQAEAPNAGAAANTLRYQLIAAAQQYPGAENLVYYFGSGAQQSDAPQGTFESDGVDGGAVFGYGSAAGRPQLAAIADQLGLPYFSRSPGAKLPQAQDRPATSAARADDASGAPRTEFYWLLSIVAAVLLLGEISLSVRDLRRARATQRQVRS